MQVSRSIVWVVASVFCLAAVARAEKVANPSYEQWSKFKVGAFAKLESDIVAQGMTTKTTTTTKLVELTPDKAVLEITTSMLVMGQKMDQPVQKIDVPAQIEKAADAPADKPKVNTGEETVKVAGKDIKATWTETETTMGGMTIKAKTWTSPEVPGSVVKMTSVGSGAMASNTTTTLVEHGDGK